MNANGIQSSPIILASVTRRAASKAIDGSAALLIFLAVRFTATALLIHVPEITARGVNIAACIAAFAYLLLADALPNGQSIGKRLLSIAVVDRNVFRPATLTQSVTRNAGALIILDWIWIFLESRTRLGDMYAKTIVIQVGKLSYKVRSISDVYQEAKPGF
ncbi:RDD family protein [Pseudomonas sp. Marseille-QA0892]